MNLAQFPEDQNKKNRDHEQQELDIHFVSSLPAQGIVNAQSILLLGFELRMGLRGPPFDVKMGLNSWAYAVERGREGRLHSR